MAGLTLTSNFRTRGSLLPNTESEMELLIVNIAV